MKNGRMFFVATLALVGIAFAGGAYVYSNQAKEAAAKAEPVAQDLLVRPDSPVIGAENAKVTIVEFLDPECEACRAMHPIVKQLLKEYDGKVRVVIRYMPFHASSLYAASVLEEARVTGRFEQALETLYENQPEWGSHYNPRPDLIPSYLVKIGMEEKALDRSYVLGKHGSKIERDNLDGMKLGVMATPTFFVNGQKLDLQSLGIEGLKEAIERELAKP